MYTYICIYEHTCIFLKYPLVSIQNAQIACDSGQLSAPVTSISEAQTKQMAGTGMNSLFTQNFRPTLQIYYHHDFSQ